MSSRIRIYDKTGTWLAEIDASFNRAWKLNEYGNASFTMSLKDSKAILDNLQFGNLIYVEHEKLPDWGGVIYTTRTWGEGKITTTVYSGEYLLTGKVSPPTQIEDGRYGTIYEQLITEKISILPAVEIGNIFGGGPTIESEFHFAELYAEVKKLSTESGCDWRFEPKIDADGKLIFEADWHKTIGQEVDFIFYEDRHIKLSSTALREQGRIANRIYLYGDGATFESRPVAERFDTESEDLYGTWELAKSASGTTPEQLEDIADEMLIEMAHPRKTFSITVLDVGDAFYHCRIGNTIPIQFYTVGYTGAELGVSTNLRIKQMIYSDENNQLDLVADEVIE